MSNLSAAFRDRDEDMLTHGAASSAEEVATVSVTDGLATVAAVLIGESAVTLTATDAAGSNRTAEQAFTVTGAPGHGHAADVSAAATKLRRTPGAAERAGPSGGSATCRCSVDCRAR